MRVIRILCGWLLAVAIAALLGSVIQTQYNLADLGRLGVTIEPGTGLDATVHDLLHFAPLYGGLIGVAFAVAWPVAGMLARRRPAARRWLFPLAGLAAVAVMLVTMNAVLPVTPVAATRDASAVLLMALAGGVAGLVYTRLIAQSDSTS